MEYIGFGDIEIKKLGDCGGVGCSSCNCNVEVYNDYKLYVTCSMIVLVPENGSDVMILPMANNNIHNVRFKRTGL